MKSQLAGSFFIESSKPPASIAQSNKQWVRPARTQIVQKFSKVQLRFSPYNDKRRVWQVKWQKQKGRGLE